MIGLRLGSRLWWGLLSLVVLLWGAGALVTTVLPGIPVTPLATLVTAPVVAYAQEVSLAITLGALITSIWCRQARVLRWAAGWAAIGLGLTVASAAALQSDVTARTLGADAPGLYPLLVDTPIGRAVLVQICSLLACLLLLAGAGVITRAWPLWCALALVAVCVAAPAFAGHAGLSSEHQIAGISTGLHAVAISLWVGGLAVASARCLQEPGEAGVILPRFSLLALVCVVVAAETGLLSASLTVGTLGDLVGSTYGSLIVAKAVVLAWLIRLGWLQRRRALDLLPDASVPGVVARIAGTELLLMGSAIAASVVLVRIGPPSIPAEGFAPLSLVSLAIALPILLSQLPGRGWRVANAWPEAAMVVLLLVLIEVGGVGLLRTLAGGFGLAAEVLLVVLAGWVAMCAARRSIESGSIASVVIALVGLPMVLAVNALISGRIDAAGAAGWRMSIVAGLIGEVLLLGMLPMARQARIRSKAVDAEVAA